MFDPPLKPRHARIYRERYFLRRIVAHVAKFGEFAPRGRGHSPPANALSSYAKAPEPTPLSSVSVQGAQTCGAAAGVNFGMIGQYHHDKGIMGISDEMSN
jgi:hypothetical protein